MIPQPTPVQDNRTLQLELNHRRMSERQFATCDNARLSNVVNCSYPYPSMSTPSLNTQPNSILPPYHFHDANKK